jgi:hypothetical protein
MKQFRLLFLTLFTLVIALLITNKTSARTPIEIFLDDYSPYAKRIIPVTGTPIACSENQVFWDMTNHRLLSCETNNVVKQVPLITVGSSLTATPAGSDTQVQFNDAGSFGGDSGFTFNKTTDDLSIGRDVLATRQVLGQFGTFTPLSDIPTFTFRRFSATQTSNFINFQTEANASLSFIDKSGVFNGNIIGTARLSNLTTNGFVKTSSANGTLIVDTNTYAITTGANSFTGNQTFSTILAASDGVSNIGTGSASRFNIFAYGISVNRTATPTAGAIETGSGANVIQISNGATVGIRFGSSVGINAASNPESVAPDVGLWRNAAGVWEINNAGGATGTSTNFRDLKLRSLFIFGGLTRNLFSFANSITLTATDDVWIVTAASQTITLPSAVGIQGKTFTVKNNNGVINTTVATTSSQTIDGSTTFSLSLSNGSITVISDNANWQIIAKV